MADLVDVRKILGSSAELMGTLAYFERALKLKRCDFTFWGAAPDHALAGRQPLGMIKTHPRQLPGAWVPYRLSRGLRGYVGFTLMWWPAWKSPAGGVEVLFSTT